MDSMTEQRDAEEIQWLGFAELLRGKYAYLLNLNLCLRIAVDARDYAAGTRGEEQQNGRQEQD